MIYIIGITGFIAKHLYICLKKQKVEVRCLTHNELTKLCADDDDIIINCCGVNSGETFDAFNQANNLFVQDIVRQLGSIRPFLIHISSLMVNGFKDQSLESLSETQQFFIRSKRAGEDYLLANYPQEKLCIVRPSNIYGYSCRPYYNNLLVTLVHEKINKEHRITQLNRNCVRNFLSIDGLCFQILSIIENKLVGIRAIVSDNTLDLESLTLTLYANSIVPNQIIFNDGDQSVTNMDEFISYDIVGEKLNEKLIELERKMISYNRLALCHPVNLNRLTQPRGDMIEISDLRSDRLYMITLTEGSVRGNHYHYEQIEHFYQHRGNVLYLVSHASDPDVVQIHVMQEGQLLIINPYIIHTLVNDFINNECEVIVSSTQRYISGCVPDTKYINII